MIKLNKSLILSVLFACICYPSYDAEAKVCFLVGGCNNESAKTATAKTQDCNDLGYKYTDAECARLYGKDEISGIAKKVGGDGTCKNGGTSYYKGCVCNPAYYSFANEETNKYSYSDSCKIDGVYKYHNKFCRAQYKYVSDVTDTGNWLNALVTGVHSREIVSCDSSTHAVNNACVDSYGLNKGAGYPQSITRYLTCNCNPSVYRYQEKWMNSSTYPSIFTLEGKCVDPDGTVKYSTAGCSGKTYDGYIWRKDRCADGETEITAQKKYIYDGSFVCHACKRSCTGMSYDDCVSALNEKENAYKRCKRLSNDCYSLESTCAIN